jgi:hypothetical protein
MTEEEGREPTEQGERAGYEDLSMNVVPAAVTEERSEAGRRAGGVGLLLAVVAAAVVIVVLGSRLFSNAPPGEEAEQRLRARLQSLSIWQEGVLREAKYLAGDRLRVDFSPRLSTVRAEERERIREATRVVMGVLMKERPGRDLHIEGYQGEEQVVRAELRHKSTITGPGGEQVPDMVIRVEGDPTGGVGEAYGRSGKGMGGR